MNYQQNLLLIYVRSMTLLPKPHFFRTRDGSTSSVPTLLTTSLPVIRFLVGWVPLHRWHSWYSFTFSLITTLKWISSPVLSEGTPSVLTRFKTPYVSLRDPFVWKGLFSFVVYVASVFPHIMYVLRLCVCSFYFHRGLLRTKSSVISPTRNRIIVTL